MAEVTLYELLPREKTCPRCGVTKPASDFLNKKTRLSGYCIPCNKAYQREWYVANADAVKARSIQWSAANKEQKRKTDRAYRAANKEAVNAKSKAWVEKNIEKRRDIWRRSYQKNKSEADRRSKAWIVNNPIRVRERSRRLKLAREQASVVWANPAAVLDIYRRAAEVTKSTGIPHEVDHIIPICGRNVCGLHWEGNLQILPMQENRRKSNKVPNV